MNRFERESLDRHITGNYGEDFFRGEREMEDGMESLRKAWAFMQNYHRTLDFFDIPDNDRDEAKRLCEEVIVKIDRIRYLVRGDGAEEEADVAL